MAYRTRACLLLLCALPLVACDDDDGIDFDAGDRPDAGMVPMDAGPPEAACDDGERNGDESGIDCGGSCDPCADGDPCNVADDCESGVCDREPLPLPHLHGRGAATAHGVGRRLRRSIPCPLCGGGESLHRRTSSASAAAAAAAPAR